MPIISMDFELRCLIDALGEPPDPILVGDAQEIIDHYPGEQIPEWVKDIAAADPMDPLEFAKAIDDALVDLEIWEASRAAVTGK